MTTTSTRRDQLRASLRDKEYRDFFVESSITNALAFQIRAMREDRGWTQEDLGCAAGMAQETVSLLESPNYGKYTLRTLKRLASAFDVALLVRFAPFTQLTNWVTDLSPNDLAVPAFAEDVVKQDTPRTITKATTISASRPTEAATAGNLQEIIRDKVVSIASYRQSSTVAASSIQPEAVNTGTRMEHHA